MRLNGYTVQEIESLERVTAARCSATPQLLGVRVDAQNESILTWEGSQWWMPGGYVVYILMTKVPGQSLDIGTFWVSFTAQDRQEIRKAFREAWM